MPEPLKTSTVTADGATVAGASVVGAASSFSGSAERSAKKVCSLSSSSRRRM